MNKRNRIKGLFVFFLAGLIIIICARMSEAGTYWVSNNGAATWASCNSSTPLSGTLACSADTAMSNAVAGDIVNFRGGTYVVPKKDLTHCNGGSCDSYQNYYQPAHSGSCSTNDSPCSGTISYITFQAYTGETPLFQGTPGGTGDLDGTNGLIMATIMGAFQQSYLIFDGFSFEVDQTGCILSGCFPRMHFGDDSSSSFKAPPFLTHDVIVRNCTFIGPTVTIVGTDNAEELRLDDVQYFKIYNNKFTNMRSSIDWHNTSAVKAYNGYNLDVYNNEIINSTAGLYYKSNVNTVNTSNNFIHDGYLAIFCDAWSTGYTCDNHKIYNNVIVNNSFMAIQLYAESGGTMANPTVYNNTVYAASSSGGVFLGGSSSAGASTGQQVYNNIILTGGNGSGLLVYNCGPITTSDYNNFGTSAFKVQINYGSCSSPTSYSGLASWKASGTLNGGGNPDTHSIASDPLFVNASGTLTQLNDFKLAANSPSIATGINGKNMGADVTIVGTSGTAKLVAAPTGLKVQ